MNFPRFFYPAGPDKAVKSLGKEVLQLLVSPLPHALAGVGADGVSLLVTFALVSLDFESHARTPFAAQAG